MMKLPIFKLFGEDDPAVNESIQPSLPLRDWGDLSASEKKLIFQQLTNEGWVYDTCGEIAYTIRQLNHRFLQQCPGKKLHSIAPVLNINGELRNESEIRAAAHADFQRILLTEESEPLVLRMLSIFISRHINQNWYNTAKEADTNEERERAIKKAFSEFDRLTKSVNHIFEQFSVNQLVTRNGFVPRQDERITAAVYTPTLRALSDPKWQAVSDDLTRMFQDYSERNFAETITKGHAAIQRFLQILVGEEGKSGRGEVGKLFQEAKKKGLIPINQFSEQFINAAQSAIVAERATNSTAKPTLKEATSTDALLMMNLVMVFLQHCLAR